MTKWQTVEENDNYKFAYHSNSDGFFADVKLVKLFSENIREVQMKSTNEKCILASWYPFFERTLRDREKV